MIRCPLLLSKFLPSHKSVLPSLSMCQGWYNTRRNIHEDVIQKDYPYFFRVLESLPKNRSLAFAYGSGVFKQAGKAWTKNSMSDFIIATPDPVTWHAQNLELNPHHYPTTIRLLGPKFISYLQTNFGAKIYFNTLIPFEDGLIKYGVISTSDLMADLENWTTLYVSGRLHKPVNILEQDQSLPELRLGLASNLTSALHASLLGLPEKFTPEELYLQLAGLSYSGDLRMLVGEDKNKVQNIVSAQMSLFEGLYDKRLKALFSDSVHFHNGTYTQDKSDSSKLHHLQNLPSSLIELMLGKSKSAVIEGLLASENEVLNKSSASGDLDPKLQEVLRESISTIVQRSSTPQALKGIISAGPYKAAVYSSAKLKKMMKSLK
eukprot:TRINITY_DN3420_c0_g1_i10.p1 TRINITY_DN3420_c0_g1~~TRINITY_DN3420_c0_g1_i10.p1  ORF type:complete len:376 (+),score=11.87 TRINITY_DN3420_c0_g1_i10:56-1183(+)